MRTGRDEARDPKYAHIERERRWLVDVDARPDIGGLSSTLIEDRYITGTRLRLRRMTADDTGNVALKLTKKYNADNPIARPIVTAYLDAAEFAVFAQLPATPVTKRRYRLADRGVHFSLDCFEGALAPLEIVEIEWPDDAGLRALQAPLWAVREISNDPRFQGGALATNGLPKD
jgi:CYTH domain-containing protein